MVALDPPTRSSRVMTETFESVDAGLAEMVV